VTDLSVLRIDELTDRDHAAPTSDKSGLNLKEGTTFFSREPRDEG
jgi:hypothetical protein